MVFRRRTVAFQPLEGSGPRLQPFTEVFPRNVLTAAAGVAGFASAFGSESDRQVGMLQIGAVASIDANTVTVEVTFGLRDWSGEWDDPYTGVVDVVIVAELEAAGAAPAREDLLITGIEITQATQFFRSGAHLDAANVMPDNSIPLIAEKATGIRVYVDYDAASGLPPIAMLSGELEVQTTTGTIALPAEEEIEPRRDAAIDRSQLRHTLTFLLPADLCRDDVTLRCRVFDAADPAQTSAAVSRPARFLPADLVRIFVVGVHYTGQGLDLPAPSLAAFLTEVGFLESTFPTPGVLATGYTTIDYSGDLNGDAASGYGFFALNDLIADLKGDSDDVYYGAIPSGPTFAGPTGAASSDVASSLVAAGVIAHEVGHRYGRPHAPCDSANRCGSPSRPDEDYPSYGNYASDSIGEFGYDPLPRTLFTPASSYDLMGYSGPNWVSPHTYTGLMSRTTPIAGLGGNVWPRTSHDTLFLGLTIDRQRRVVRRPSFHYSALPHAGDCECPCTFSVEFLDACHHVLGCHPLREDCCACLPVCWPRSVRVRLPFPAGAKWLVVWEDRVKLYEECIPDPPRVSLDCNADSDGTRFRLDWNVVPPAGAGSTERGDVIWYLVQWQDVDGSWRGLMPRTRERTAAVPVRLFGSRSRMRVRVLATSGLATGAAECVLTRPAPRPRPIAVVIAANTGPGDPPAGGAVPVGPSGIRAYAVDAAGRAVRDPGFVWFDGAGHEIARGPRLTPRHLRNVDAVRLVPTRLLSRRAPPRAQQWSLHRDARTLVLRPRPDRPDRYSEE